MSADPSSSNAYEILGVPRSADLAAVKAAFRKLAQKHHPDAVPAAEKASAGERFARINQAYELLRNPSKRRNYDAMLARGITPDLAAATGETSIPGLAEILGEIQSLNLPVDQPRLLARMDRTLREELLLPALLDSMDVRETVIDAVRMEELAAVEGYDLPPGFLYESWLVMTELRIIVLMRFVHQEGNVTNTNWRSRAFWYSSLTSFQLHEMGQAFRSYRIELEDEDESTRTFEGTKIVQAGRKTKFVLELRDVRLTRLFLVANTYRLPLKVVPMLSHGGEFWTALGKAMVLPGLWAVPFVVVCIFMGSFILTNAMGRGEKAKLGLLAGCRSIYDFLGVTGLTTVVLYVSPLLFTYLCIRVVLSRESRKADEVLGKLPLDFAEGAPAVLQEKELPDTERGTSVSPSAGQLTPAAEPTGEDRLEVEMPDAVRDALDRKLTD